MPKVKTNRSAAKRFSRTGGSKVKKGSANRRHLLTHKATKRKRNLRTASYVHPSNMTAINDLLPYRN